MGGFHDAAGTPQKAPWGSQMSVLTEPRNPAESSASSRPSAWRELAARRSGPIVVGLYWQPDVDEVCVQVCDDGTGECFVVVPRNEDALAAFHHPYAFRLENGATR